MKSLVGPHTEYMEVRQEMVVWDISPHDCIRIASGRVDFACRLLHEFQMADHCDNIVELEPPSMIVV